MARLQDKTASTGRSILLIDDEQDYVDSMMNLLRREGHEIFYANSGEAGLEILRMRHFDLLLLDYYMPGGMNGEEVVNKLREFNTVTQVILQTGYAGDYPPRELLRKLDIQGYFDKSDGPEKLLMWVDIGLKTAYSVQLLTRSKLGLQYILDITPELHKMQQISDMFQGIIYQISGLIGIVNAFIATSRDEATQPDGQEPEGFFATMHETDLIIQAATGKFTDKHNLHDHFPQSEIDKLTSIINRNKVFIDDTRTIVPLRLRDEPIGLIFIDQPILKTSDIELLEIFANQAAVAIYNATLYEMATIDPLTGVNARGFFDRWLAREVRSSFRSQTKLTLLMIDMDRLKDINDQAGHLAGDNALSLVGTVLKQSTRTSDFVSRYGGDEFAIILPDISIEQVNIVTERIFKGIKEKSVGRGPVTFPLSLSIGACSLHPHTFQPEDFPRPVPQSYFEAASEALVKRADEMLYASKKEGGSKVLSDEIGWQPF